MNSAKLKNPNVSVLKREMDGDEILSNIRAMRVVLEARGNEIEELRRIPDDIVDLMRSAGVFRMMMPRIWGGPEMNPMQINEALEELSMGNAAAAWCAMIQMDSGLHSGFLDDTLARQMFGALDSSLSNVLRASGRAQKVDGGYVVNGRWPFASGCLHADWFAGGCLLYDDDTERPALDRNGAPIFRMALASQAEFIIHDTWHTTGLRGTGSNDVEAVNLFVPDERIFAFDNKRRDGALYVWPAMLCAKMPGVVLGIARSAIESVSASLRGKNEAGPHEALAVADAQTLYASSRAYVYASLETLWARLTAGEAPTEQERIAVVLARANAFHAARSAVQLMYDTAGAGAIYSKNSVLDRHLRDINTACQHLMAQRKGQQAAGALALEIEASFFPFL